MSLVCTNVIRYHWWKVIQFFSARSARLHRTAMYVRSTSPSTDKWSICWGSLRCPNRYIGQPFTLILKPSDLHVTLTLNGVPTPKGPMSARSSRSHCFSALEFNTMSPWKVRGLKCKATSSKVSGPQCRLMENDPPVITPFTMNFVPFWIPFPKSRTQGTTYTQNIIFHTSFHDSSHFQGSRQAYRLNKLKLSEFHLANLVGNANYWIDYAENAKCHEISQ